MKKGLSPFFSLILVVAISLAGIVLVLRVATPFVEKTEDYSRFSEAKDLMNQINSAVKEVSAEGNGSSRKIQATISGGEYRVSASEDAITYEMETRHDLFSSGLSRSEGDLYVEFYNSTLMLILNSTAMNLTNDERWSRGFYEILVRSGGFSGGNNMVSVAVV